MQPQGIETPEAEPIRIADTLKGRSIFVIGSTGFLGKVYLYLLLHRHADLKKIYLLIRPKKGVSPQERFRKEVLPAEVFDPLRERLGEEGFLGLIDEKVEALAGDITLPCLGLSEETRDALRGKVDVLVNSSGLVDFTPPLNEAISINAMGVQNAVDAALDIGAKYVAVSTCYVAGARQGRIFEDEPIYGYFPRKDEMQGVTFDPRREIEEGLQLVARAREEAFHQEHQSAFIHAARQKLIENHRNPDDPEALARELEAVRDRWVKRRLSEVGARRAQGYGWSNTYTYTKSLGEQLVVSTPDLDWTIVRPAIIESSLRHPFPGWNEGINTTAPLVFLTLQGQLRYPSNNKHPLDIIPVDMIAGPMVAITAALILGRARPVYQLGSSDANPMSMRRVVELTGLYKRRYYQARSRGTPILNELYARVEPRNVTQDRYKQISSPYVGTKATQALKLMDRWKAVKRLPFLKPVESQIKALEKQSIQVDKLMQVFMPFIWDYEYRFKTDNVQALYAELSPEDRAAIPFDPENLDWLTYWIYVHVKGLEKWVFPKIKDRLKRNPLPKVYTYEDLLELFDASTTNNADKVAFRMLSDAEEVTFTYAQLRERAGWVAQRLRKEGVAAGDRVMILSENRPEWGMSYFGILQAGASAVPVDSKSSTREVVNLYKAAEAKALLLSEEVLETLGEALRKEIPDALLLPFAQVFGAPDTSAPKVALIPATQRSQMASLIFTSGTTGVPKGVVLTHKNLTSLLSALAKIFRLNDRDKVLSVLPLHHTFEFTAGFLLPLSRGSTVTYLKTLNGDSLTGALKDGRITAMVGVPALWELIHRGIINKVEERGALAELLFLGLTGVSKALRERAGLNLGRILFGQVHRGLGGHLRYLISGGAALPKDVFDGFDALGLDLYEGYGLTEASPVLAVNRPGHRPVRGSVGTALPDVEIRIKDPNAEGLGEIIARGPNVMEGYLGNQEATDGVIKDGWLHTGDIGRIGKGGNIYIVGRAKEVIVDGSGKNIYPDEVEDLYAGGPYVSELSVVGLPDGRGSERVAAIAVLDDEKIAEDGLTLADARVRFEDHVRHVELTLPYHQRIKVMRFKEGDLPRTATRKVKRREVVKLLEGMLSAENTVISTTAEGGGQPSTIRTVQAAIARITGKKTEEIRPTSRLDADLGLDSLMATELVGALEEHGAHGLEIQDLVEAATVGGVADLLGRRASSAALPAVIDAKEPRVRARERVKDVFDISLGRLHEVQIPEDIRLPIKDVLGVLQRLTYNQGFKVKVKGLAFLPQANNVLVIANHSSHLDMGLVKVALGGYGRNLVTMAAADYFFSDGPRRFYFENFTNAIPLDRIVPKRDSIRNARLLLEQGNNLLMFPEGTRSLDGTVQPFKRGVGMMALRFEVDVLPVYIDGTYRTLPKGAWLPKARDMEVRVGAPIHHKDLARITKGMSPLQAQTTVARLLQKAVESLRDNKVFDLDAAAQLDADGGEEHPMLGIMRELEGKYKPGEFQEPVTFYFSLGTAEAAKWTLRVDQDGPTFQQGKHGDADCVLKTSTDVFAKIVREGYQPGVSDFMSGMIKTNDINRLAQFQVLFGLGDF